MNKRKHFLLISFALITTLASCQSESLASSDFSSSSSYQDSSSLSSASSLSSSSSSSNSSSSTSERPEIVNLSIYGINDFHGSIDYIPDNGEIGITRLATYFDLKKQLNPEGTIILSSGDMWQGSADSNLTKGRLVTEAMNLIGFEAMALGNHEFDWGQTVIEANRDLANFPFLGANIFEKATNELASFVTPHTMIERSGVKIGIIGTIGPTLGGSILPSIAALYDFKTTDSYVNLSAQQLRSDGAEIIVLLNHNPDISAGSLSAVDLVFNGHTHTYESQLISGKPNLQARSHGEAVAYANIQYSTKSKTITYKNYGVESNIASLGLAQNEAMVTLYNRYYEQEINEIKNEVIGTASGYFARDIIGMLTVEEMLNFGRLQNPNVVASFHNTAGVLATIDSGQVNYGQVYKALPFDNDLVILSLTGSQLKVWVDNSRYYMTGVNTNYIFDDGTSIKTSQIYTIITISYLSENLTYNPHDVSSEVILYTYARDLVAHKWRESGTLYAYNY